MKFIGVDLGWKSQPSGLCCLEWVEEKLHLLALERLAEIADILDWIERHTAQADAIVAVDAPTIIPNATGTRLPD